MQKQNPSFVGIDIGTANTRVVIGLLDENNDTPTIIGAGSAPNKGMRKGAVNNVDETAQSVSRAIEEAERISGQRVGSATVSVNGGHVIGLNSRGVIAISSSSHEITFEDVERVEEAAAVVQLPPNREILQVFAKSYHLDGQEYIKDPVGMSGVRLEVDAHIVTAATPVIKNLNRTMDLLNVEVNSRVVAGLASAESVLEPKQRESGTVVVDFGAGTTSVAVFEEDEVQHVAVLPVGSTNVTNDLAIGLKTDLDVAEEVKVKHARASEGSSKGRSTVEISREDDEKLTFKREDIDDIVQARLDELFELVDKELKKINKSGKLPGGVVLVGGGSLLPGIDEFVKDKLELPARVMKPKNYSGVIDITDTPAYACAVGLMMQDMHYQNAGSSRMGGLDLNPSSFTNMIKSLINRLRP